MSFTLCTVLLNMSTFLRCASLIIEIRENWQRSIFWFPYVSFINKYLLIQEVNNNIQPAQGWREWGAECCHSWAQLNDNFCSFFSCEVNWAPCDYTQFLVISIRAWDILVWLIVVHLPSLNLTWWDLPFFSCCALTILMYNYAFYLLLYT